MNTKVTNRSDNIQCNEYIKLQLCLGATALQNIWNDGIKTRALKIKFPIWLWYSEGGDVVSCDESTENVKDILNLYIEWKDAAIYIYIHNHVGPSKYVRFDDPDMFELFLNNIEILDRNGENYIMLFPLGCIEPLIYDDLF